jgi:hypothetical protein
MRRIAMVLLAGWWVAGCTTSEVLVAHTVPLEKATVAIPEAELLDVAVKVFDSGVPEGEVDKDVLESLIRQGTFVQIRRSESVYMPVVLRDTLQKTGNWGAVWVTPRESSVADVDVTAKILHSDGDVVQLHVVATDATGRVWIDQDYQMSTAAGAFNRQRYPDLDPYQDVFNEIANDLVAARDRLSPEERSEIRNVAGMRYAADLSPDAFGGYVAENGKGRYELKRLPANEDPMFDRTQRVRQRERVFLDTLDQHYEQFYQEASKPYNGWREYAREEAIEIKELTKQAHWRTGMGVATIVASIVYGNNNNNSFSDRVVRDAMMYIGMDMIRTSQVRKQEKKVHADTLDELSSSFDTEIKPMVVSIQGTEHRLTGTADAQYQEWQDLLRQIFIRESGFVPEDVTISTEPEVEKPVELPPVPVAKPAPAAGETPSASGGEATTEGVPDASATASGGV